MGTVKNYFMNPDLVRRVLINYYHDNFNIAISNIHFHCYENGFLNRIVLEAKGHGKDTLHECEVPYVVPIESSDIEKAVKYFFESSENILKRYTIDYESSGGGMQFNGIYADAVAETKILEKD